MKKICFLIIASVLTIVAQAQTLNVVTGNVTWQFPAAQVGEMNYTDGTSLTILDKTFSISDIEQIYIDDSEVEDNTVGVNYTSSSASVVVAGNVAQYITATLSGAHVTLEQSDALDDTVGEITYTLSGSSSDGEFYLSGSYKATVVLDGLELQNPSGAPLNIQDGKRVKVSMKKDTENTLVDCSDGDQKACLVVKGHAEFRGQGTLNVKGLTKHAIKSGEYMSVRNCTINVLAAEGDGIHCNEYFQQESGTISISGVSDDGIQVELDGDTSTGETTDHEDEDSGNIYLEGGNLTITVTGAATKGIKGDGDIVVSNDPVLSVTTTGGGAFDSDDNDAKGCAGISSDGNITINGGTITLKSTGAGGKCLKADTTLTVTGGTLTATSTGSQYRYSSSYTSSAKAIKVGTTTTSGRTSTSKGAIVVEGGIIIASASSHEAIESKGTITISDGEVYAYSSDDAINSGSTFTISGGYVMGNSTGNDGLDANGNFIISDGTVFAIGTTTPEVAIDANTEGGYILTFSGGTLIAIGGLENGSSISQTCYQTSSYTKGSWYGLYNGNDLEIAFKVPSNNSMGSSLIVSTSGTTTLKKGVTVSGGTSIWNGFGSVDCSVSGGSSVSLSSYSGGNSGGGGGTPGGGGGGGPGGGGGWW